MSPRSACGPRTPRPPLPSLVTVAALVARLPSLLGQRAPRADRRGVARAAPSGPPDLTFSTFLGGLEWDEATDVEVDDDGQPVRHRLHAVAGLPGRRGRGAGRHPGRLRREGLRRRHPGVERRARRHRPGRRATASRSTTTGTSTSPGAPARRTSRPPRALQPRTERQRRARASPATTRSSPSSTRTAASSTAPTSAAPSTRRGWRSPSTATAAPTSRATPTPATCRPCRPFQAEFGSPPCPGDLPCGLDVFVSKLSPDGERPDVQHLPGRQCRRHRRRDRGRRRRHGLRHRHDPVVGLPDRGTRSRRALNGDACGPPPGGPCPDASSPR